MQRLSNVFLTFGDWFSGHYEDILGRKADVDGYFISFATTIVSLVLYIMVVVMYGLNVGRAFNLISTIIIIFYYYSIRNFVTSNAFKTMLRGQVGTIGVVVMLSLFLDLINQHQYHTASHLMNIVNVTESIFDITFFVALLMMVSNPIQPLKRHQKAFSF